MEIISQLGLDSWGGFFSFALTAASLALPVLIAYNKRRKKALGRSEALSGNFIIAANSEKWRPAPAKIIKFVFATDPVVVTKKKVKDIALHGSAPLVAVVEYQDINGATIEGQVFLGDEIYDENVIINIRYNPLDKKQIILA